MAVEIVILSGSRQGERLVFEGERFWAGDEPACAVFFNPALDPAARGRMLLFRHSEEGWSVEPVGAAGIMLDHDPLSAPRTIRSGQVVRMSADGPDFSFRVVAASAARQGGTGVLPAAQLGGTGVSPVSTGKMPVPSAPGVDSPAAVPAARQSESTILARWLLIYMLAGVGMTAAVFLIGWAIFAGRLGNGTTATTTKPEVLVPAMPIEPDPEPEKPKPPPAAAKPWEVALEPFKKAIYLLEFEQTAPDGVTMAWPFASCCAIADNVLLTTGNVGCELLRFRHKKFKIYATRPEEHIREEVTEVRIRADYIKQESDLTQRRFCDLALLMVAGRLPSVAPVATRQELAAVERGVRLELLGYPIDVKPDPITVHDEFSVKVTEGKVFRVWSLEPQIPDTPRCLDLNLKAEVLPKSCFYGSAVFTREGKLVGVYNEPPEKKEVPGVENLHFITAVQPEMIKRGLTDRNAPLWVEPKVAAAPGPGGKP